MRLESAQTPVILMKVKLPRWVPGKHDVVLQIIYYKDRTELRVKVAQQFKSYLTYHWRLPKRPLTPPGTISYHFERPPQRGTPYAIA